jgi:GxxExxY protein
VFILSIRGSRSELLFVASLRRRVSQVYDVIVYKGEELKQTYKPDLICYDKIIIELKALRDLTGEHRSQVLNYLKGTDLRLGLLVNFGCSQKATVERIVL